MKTATRTRAPFLRSALVAIPLAVVSLTPVSAEPRPTPVRHDGSLVAFVSQHLAADRTASRLSPGASRSRAQASANGATPANRYSANVSQAYDAARLEE